MSIAMSTAGVGGYTQRIMYQQTKRKPPQRRLVLSWYNTPNSFGKNGGKECFSFGVPPSKYSGTGGGASPYREHARSALSLSVEHRNLIDSRSCRNHALDAGLGIRRAGVE